MSKKDISILLVNPPIRMESDPECYPYGLAIIASSLRQQGFSPEILDLNILRWNDEKEINDYFSNKVFNIIGIGGLITTYKFLKSFLPKINVLQQQALIVVGGGVVTDNPEFILRNTPTDIAVIGEGEITFNELVNRYYNNQDLYSIEGISYLIDNQLVFTKPRKLISNISTIPFPAYDLLNIEYYLKSNSSLSFLGNKATMHIYAGRGCPNICHFCYHIFGRGARFRSVSNILEEMDFLYEKYPMIDSWLFGDENLLASRKLIEEFCADYPKRSYGKFPWACYGRVDLVNDKILPKLKYAGCKCISFGIESGSQKILNNMNKGVTVKQAIDAIKMVRKHGIWARATFIYGYPGEDDYTIQETINFCKEVAINPYPFFATPYPGTVFYKSYKKNILSKYGDEESFIFKLDDATKFTINLTDWNDEVFLKKFNDFVNQFRPNNILQKCCALLRHYWQLIYIIALKARNLIYVLRISKEFLKDIINKITTINRLPK